MQRKHTVGLLLLSLICVSCATAAPSHEAQKLKAKTKAKAAAWEAWVARGRLHATHALAKAGGTIDGIAQKALGNHYIVVNNQIANAKHFTNPITKTMKPALDYAWAQYKVVTTTAEAKILDVLSKHGSNFVSAKHASEVAGIAALVVTSSAVALLAWLPLRMLGIVGGRR
eukprot:jgi/Astpho2/6416/Aster-08100